MPTDGCSLCRDLVVSVGRIHNLSPSHEPRRMETRRAQVLLLRTKAVGAELLLLLSSDGDGGVDRTRRACVGMDGSWLNQTYKCVLYARRALNLQNTRTRPASVLWGKLGVGRAGARTLSLVHGLFFSSILGPQQIILKKLQGSSNRQQRSAILLGVKGAARRTDQATQYFFSVQSHLNPNK